MDTPDKGRIPALSSSSASAVAGSSKSEESPFFNFVNSLSPIPPVKPSSSLQSVQLFKTSDFAPAIFTSPHVNTLKDSSHCSRDSYVDIGCFSGDVRGNLASVSTNDIINSGTAGSQNSSQTCFLNEAVIDPPDNSSDPPSQFGTYSPEHSVKSCNTTREDLSLHGIHRNRQNSRYGVVRRKNSFDPSTAPERKHSTDQTVNPEEIPDYEYSMPQPRSDLLVLQSTVEVKEETEAGTSGNAAGSCKLLSPNNSTDAGSIRERKIDEARHSSFQPETCHLVDYVELAEGTEADFNSKMMNSASQNEVVPTVKSVKFKANDQAEPVPKSTHQHRGIRRRCLTYEATRESGMNVHTESTSGLRTPSINKCTSISNSRCREASQNPLCMLPSIGLHLNSVGCLPKENFMPYETSAAGEEHTVVSSDISVPPTFEHTNHVNLLVGNELAIYDSEVNCHGDQLLTEELFQGSPKKKRRKSEDSGDGDACKRCSCKKSKCLKLYCECFAAGVYCSEPCGCLGCFNKPVHEEMVLSTRKLIESRNPLAFAPKVIRKGTNGDPAQVVEEDMTNTPASARHKRGCNCKKSNCLKKYCECYQGGVGCSVSCRCEGCKNSFGAREGMSNADLIQHGEEDKNAIQDGTIEGWKEIFCAEDIESLSLAIFPLTPSLDTTRTFKKTSRLSSKKRPPYASSTPVVSSSQSYDPLNLLRHESQSSPVDKPPDGPEFLNEDNEPLCATVKRSSPNSKRVTLLRSRAGLSPIGKNGRKLILKSIPAFPSLCDVHSDHPVESSSGAPTNPFI